MTEIYNSMQNQPACNENGNYIVWQCNHAVVITVSIVSIVLETGG